MRRRRAIVPTAPEPATVLDSRMVS